MGVLNADPRKKREREANRCIPGVAFNSTRQNRNHQAHHH